MQRLNRNLLRIKMLFLLTLSLSACKVSNSGIEEETIQSIKIVETIEVDSVIADFPVGFGFLTSGEMQFIGYYNKHRELTVASRKISEKKWTYKILPTKVGWDSHNRITMAIDRDDCLHLSGNMHNDTLIYFKTDKPNDISTFKKVFPIVSAQDELRCTYPRFTKNATNELIFTYRKGGSGNGITIANIYDEQSKTFRRLTDQPLFDGLGLMSAYASGPILGPDSIFHVIWLWRDTPGCETNHDLSYARSSDWVHWKTMDGRNMELPITPKSDQVTVDPVPPKGGAINGGTKLFFDANNNPMIAYIKYDTIGNSQIYLATKQDKQWGIKQVSNWNYRWNFSGPGSIEFEIKLKKCYLTDDQRIVISYSHIKKGNGELIIDPKSLSLIEDKSIRITEKSAYPTNLLSPTSNIDSAAVSWLKSDSPLANEYYGLRWETMGKRRFYQPREKPVKPSVMKLYRFKRD